MSRLKAVSAALAIAGALLSGCAAPLWQPHTHTTTTAPMPVVTTQLHTHHWTLQQALGSDQQPEQQWFVHASDTQPARTVQIDFEDNQRVHVARLCNSMQGVYQTQGSQLQISALVSTMMACPDSRLMQLEQEVGQRLAQATSWRLIDSSTLELQFAQGQRWQLHGTPKYSVLYGPAERIFLEIAPQTASCHLPNIREAQCLQVRTVQYDGQGLKQQVGVWQPFYDSIEGYTHQAGTRSIVRLNRYTLPQPAQDGSRFIYVHDLTVEHSTKP